MNLCQFTFEDMKHFIHVKISSVNISDRPIYRGKPTITQTETNKIVIKDALKKSRLAVLVCNGAQFGQYLVIIYQYDH